ncbi:MULTISPECIES: EAL domain-containing protein [unclassified Cedecea]|uniref:EAL domain-containing protein n=1 Tax=unclassified Cedecea TaxID=2649846 RepID=UPI003015F1B8
MFSRQDLIYSLERQYIIPYFQPVHDSASGRCIGAEVLARLYHPEYGIVPPADFLAYLQDMDGLAALTQTLMIKVGHWLGENPVSDGFILTFNIPPNMAGQTWLLCASQALRSLSAHRVVVVLELTEQLPLTDISARFQRRLRRLRYAGVKIALDDFGTGYAGFSLMQQVAGDMLKIPREFVSQAMTCYITASIIDNIISLTRHLGMKVIAEGVESKEQVDLLAKKGIVLMQGFYFSPPLNAADFETYMTMEKLCD